MGRTGLVWEPRCLLHQPGLGHPERPQRLEAIRNGLEQAGLWERCEQLAARFASDSELLRCHTAPYLQLVSQEIDAGRQSLSTGDTSLSADTEDAARLAATKNSAKVVGSRRRRRRRRRWRWRCR